jgi:hypothetical protein
MAKIFRDPWDIDGIAQELYGEVTPETRQKVKTITFMQRWSRPGKLSDMLKEDSSER